MFDIYKAELFRFRYWALAYFLVHGGGIAFYGRLSDLLQQGPMIVQGAAAVYGFTGLLLGLYQMGGYRRPNRWLNLIHRPLEPRRIALALVAAGITLLAFAVALPWLAMLSAQEMLSARVVDVRHWLLPAAITLVSAAGYLAGAYSALGVRRFAPFVLILPALLAFSNATGLGAIAVQALTVAWLLYLVMTAFKPDLNQVPRRIPELTATVLPVQMGIYLALGAVGGTLFQLTWIMLGSHPLNSTPRAGGFVEAARGEGRDVITSALADHGGPQARLWRGQAQISDTFKIQPSFDQLPVRGELTNTVPVEFEDPERRVAWTFSHDTMRFQGRSTTDGTPHGSLGLGGDGKPFERPPVSLGDGTLVDARSLANYDSEIEQILPRLEVPMGETIASPPVEVGESVALLTDKALYLYDSAVLKADDREFPPHQRIRLAGKIGNLERIDVMELLDGYLVSETFGRGASEGNGDPKQFLLHSAGAGQVRVVSNRTLINDFPSLTRFQPLWLSPALSFAYEAAINLFAPRTPLQEYDGSRPPTTVLVLAIFLAVVSVIGALWWGARIGMARSQRVVWTAAAAFVGLPALISFVLFHPRHPDRS